MLAFLETCFTWEQSPVPVSSSCCLLKIKGVQRLLIFFLFTLEDLCYLGTLWTTESMWCTAAVLAYRRFCVFVSIFLAMIDMQTGLISRDLWALTGCRLVSTATSKGWWHFTYPDGGFHSHAQLHVAHCSGAAWRLRELQMWSQERKRSQHKVGVARSLRWVNDWGLNRFYSHGSFRW